jgi:PAS domain-containing protein
VSCIQVSVFLLVLTILTGLFGTESPLNNFSLTFFWIGFVLGFAYLTAYDPIRNGQGEILGVLFVGVKKVDFLARFSGLRIELALLLVGLVAVFATLMGLLGRVAKKFETTKEEQMEFAESLVQNSTVATFVLDSRHRVIIWNRACETLTGADLKAFNTFEEPRRVAPQPLAPPVAASRMSFKLPPRSYTVAHLSLKT